MGTTPPTHACAVRFMNFCAETKFEKGASDRNSPTAARIYRQKPPRTQVRSPRERAWFSNDKSVASNHGISVIYPTSLVSAPWYRIIVEFEFEFEFEFELRVRVRVRVASSSCEFEMAIT